MPRDSDARPAARSAPACVIFDCDGVLVESEAISIRAELDFLAARGVRIAPGEYMRAFMGTSRSDWIAGIGELLARHGREVPPPAEFEALVEGIKQELVERVDAVDGAYRLVASLALPKGVASSSPLHELTAKLERTGFAALFGDRVYSAEHVKRGKPAPDLFAHAATSMGARADDCIVVEDSVNGIVAAKSAGMLAVGLVAATHCPPGHGNELAAAGADFVAASYDDLGSWLDAQAS